MVKIGYKLSYSNPEFGSCTLNADRTMNVFATPSVPSIGYVVRPVFQNAANNSLCINKTFVLKGSPTGGVWSAAGTVSVNANGVVTTNSIGIGTITYTIFNNTTGCANFRTLNYNVVSCDQLRKGEPSITGASGKIILYPNPAHDRVFFNVDAFTGKGTMVLHDTHGK